MPKAHGSQKMSITLCNSSNAIIIDAAQNHADDSSRGEVSIEASGQARQVLSKMPA
jgi:hypothetical protein